MKKACFCLILLLLCLLKVSPQKIDDAKVIDIDENDVAFDQFKIKFGKSYSNREQETTKKENFKRNIALLNSIKCGASCQVTTYFDFNQKQLQNLKGLKVHSPPNDQNLVRLNITSPNSQASKKQDAAEKDKTQSSTTSGTQTTSQTVLVGEIPATFDWRTSGKVTPVRNQGSCGSCWAFATVAFFESQVIRTKGVSPTSLDLAEQFLLKCDTKSSGCNGGSCLYASSLTISKGLPLQSTYIYDPKINYKNICKARPAYTFTGARLSYHQGAKLTDDQIIGYLSTRPIMVYVTAAYWYMYNFKTTRTFSCRPEESNSPSTIDHAVLLVGYTENDWVIKNSWGTGFGDGGYIYISRTPSANCGIGFYIYTLA